MQYEQYVPVLVNLHGCEKCLVDCKVKIYSFMLMAYGYVWEVHEIYELIVFAECN